MKKLLTILLLFFPVHGAWAEKILNLECTDNLDMRILFIVDLKKKTMTNSQGVNLRKVAISANKFQGEGTLESLSKTNETMVKRGRSSRMKTMIFEIYRTDGHYIATSYFTDGTKYESKGSCKEITKKKF